MAHSYTPGLTVTDRTMLRRHRQLPILGSVLVQVGDVVQPETVVARAALPGAVHPLNVANILGVVPDEITDYLTRRLGSSVDREEIIAESRPLITWFKTAIHSPVDGTIEAVSTVTGQVMLHAQPRSWFKSETSSNLRPWLRVQHYPAQSIL